MEREYKEHIDTIKKKINKKFLKEIENTKPFYETEKKPLKPLNFFEKEEIEGQLKWIKNKSVKQFDKIFLKKFDTRIAVKNYLYKFNEEKNKKKKNHTWAVTIDLAKCFDSVPHELIVKTAPKFIKDPLIREFILQYYNGNGTGVYQGDPLSPIIFAYISHFILQRIKPHTIHTQMYADDLILIMEGKSLLEIEKILKTKIYPIITKYGLTVNDDKTEKETEKNLKKIKYLGIWLDKKEHIQKNLDKAKDHFSRYIYIYANDRLSNALKIQLFKAVILPQVLYGLDVFNLTKTDYEKIETWINVKIKNIIKVNIGTPTDIIRWETRTEPTKHMILKRKAKFLKKLKKLELEYLNKDLKLDEIEGIDWENMEEKEIKERLHETHIKTIQNKVDSSIGEKNWKLKKYLKIAQFPNNFAQKQPYLSWKSSTTLFKLKSFSNGLCRYIYKWEPGIDSKICPCCNKKVDDVDHFIWKCEKYEKN
ncbi:nuclear intron maturase 1 -related [Anaeramoeba flamelloides]|uniref:Nuclear intron maturase 1 -related n=1 Tax=Anaeramoeba flamelloides TaxID=1746091 RepID=A0AAV8A3G4_9EUKA|nr:nuclear intron maturase 1 -related [Anaeramoeba flamelloides]